MKCEIKRQLSLKQCNRFRRVRVFNRRLKIVSRRATIPRALSIHLLEERESPWKPRVNENRQSREIERKSKETNDTGGGGGERGEKAQRAMESRGQKREREGRSHAEIPND